MGNAAQDRAEAAKLPQGDVIRVLLEQHAQMHDLVEEVMSGSGEQKEASFNALRALLAVHETAEEIVLRPVTSQVAGEVVSDARNAEEAEANKVLAQLEKMDVTSIDFDREFAEFQSALDAHAEAEEHGEFPAVLEHCTPEERQRMGSRIRAAEGLAPTHPHPGIEPGSTTQKMVGPFAALADRARDLISRAH